MTQQQKHYEHSVTGQMLTDLENGEMSREEFRQWHSGMPEDDPLYPSMTEALSVIEEGKSG